MTDIGFGMIDKRTVLIVLFSMVLSQILLNFQMPVDTSNVGNLFVDLVLFTGYLYISRSLYRLPIALAASTEVFNNITLRGLYIGFYISFDLPDKLRDGKSIVKKFLRGIVWFLSFVVSILLGLVRLFLATFTFEDWISDFSRRTFFSRHTFYRSPFIPQLFGIFDRVGLIVVSVLATLPGLHHLVRSLGIAGLVMMVAIFTLRGSFTALVKDNIE